MTFPVSGTNRNPNEHNFKEDSNHRFSRLGRRMFLGIIFGFFEYHNDRSVLMEDEDMPYTDQDIASYEDTQNYDPMDKID